MRKILLILFVVSGIPAFYSCFDELDVKPGDFFYPENYYKDTNNIFPALTGCYDALQGGQLFTGGDGLLTLWNVTDEMYYAGGGTGPKVYDYTSSYPANYSMWKACYVGIERTNQFIANVHRAEGLKDSLLNVYTGEAKFLRAFFYFVLVQNWGSVPFVTEPTKSVDNVSLAKTDEAVIYDFIIKEMADAEAMVAPISDYNHSGRISKSAVQGMLARVCLFKAGHPCNDHSKYEEAYRWAKKVIDNPYHRLNKDYAQIFINAAQDKYDNKESLWEIEFYFAGKSDAVNKEYASTLSITLGINQTNGNFPRSTGNYKIHKKLFNLYEYDDPSIPLGSKDLRRNWAIAPYSYSSLINNQLSLKYKKTDDLGIYDRNPNKFNRLYENIPASEALQSNNGSNTIMLRYSDVLLMAAEAANEMSGSDVPPAEAVEWVNMVRERAYGKLSGTRLKEIVVTNSGSGYSTASGKIPTIVITSGDAYSVTTTNTEVEEVIAYSNTKFIGSPPIATATIDGDGKITGIVIKDRGPAFTSVPKIEIVVPGGAPGSGATAEAVIGESFDHTLPVEMTDTKDHFRQAIKDERARELCFEGWRRLDLKRWNDLVPVLQHVADDVVTTTGINEAQKGYISIGGRNVTDAFYYLPIPATEMALNKSLTQNPGW